MSIGLIVPSSNPTIEAFLPAASEILGTNFLVTRIGVRRIAADADSDGQFDREGLIAAARLLVDAEVSLVSWAGTAGFWLGVDLEAAMLAEATKQVGVPVTSSRVAMFAAMKGLRERPVGVLTPYVDDVHRRVCTTIEHEGFKVVADRALGIERNLDFAHIPPPTIAHELRLLAEAGAEVLPVVCTNVLATLTELDDAPFLVIDSVLATLWHAARESGATSLDYIDCHRALLGSLTAINQEPA
jgi:maleate isomerase